MYYRDFQEKVSKKIILINILIYKMPLLKSKRRSRKNLIGSGAKIHPTNDVVQRRNSIDEMKNRIILLNLTIQQLEKHKQKFDKSMRHINRRTLDNRYKLSTRDKEESLTEQNYIELDNEHIQKLQSGNATFYRQSTKNQREIINGLKREKQDLENKIIRLRQGMGKTKKRRKHKKH